MQSRQSATLSFFEGHRGRPPSLDLLLAYGSRGTIRSAPQAALTFLLAIGTHSFPKTAVAMAITYCHISAVEISVISHLNGSQLAKPLSSIVRRPRFQTIESGSCRRSSRGVLSQKDMPGIDKNNDYMLPFIPFAFMAWAPADREASIADVAGNAHVRKLNQHLIQCICSAIARKHASSSIHIRGTGCGLCDVGQAFLSMASGALFVALA